MFMHQKRNETALFKKSAFKLEINKDLKFFVIIIGIDI